MLGYLDRSIAMYAEIGQKLDGMQKVEARKSFPSGCAKVMGRVKSWYEGIVPREQDTSVGWAGMGISVEGSGNGVFNEDFADYLNDAYWFDLAGGQNFIPEQ